jgi:hypothetical protein
MPHHPAGVAEETAERNRRGGGAESSRASTLQSFRAEVARCRVRGTPSARARVLPYAGRRDTQWRTRARITQTNLTTSSVQFSYYINKKKNNRQPYGSLSLSNVLLN